MGFIERSPYYRLTTLVSFNGTNGSYPGQDLTADGQGNLYGTTFRGGANGDGTVFELSPSFLSNSRTLTTIYSFDATTGARPQSRLLIDGEGNLFGTASAGGLNNAGVLFELASGSHAFTSLASFSSGTASHPSGALAQDANGNLYGTDYGEKYVGSGAVFQWSPSTRALANLVTFTYRDYAWPMAGVIIDGRGNLFFTTSGSTPPQTSGISNVFEYSPATQGMTALAGFDNSIGISGLVSEPSGTLYGTLSGGGAFGRGCIFQIAASDQSVSVVASFNGTNGSLPVGDLIADSQGNLYGTTVYGGTSGVGTVFKVDPTTGTITDLVSFGGDNGVYPNGRLVADTNGNLYGTTQQGGTYNQGTIFEVSVPEPASLPVGGIAAAGALVRRRKRNAGG